MADNDNSLVLDILVKYLGEDQARAALADIQNLKGSAGGTTESFKEMSRGTETATESLKGISFHGRGAHIIFSQINHIVPGMGMLMRAAFLGPLGAILAVVVAVRAAFSAFEAYNKKLDDMAKAAAQPLDGGIKTLHDVWQSAATSLAQYIAAMDAAGKDKGTTEALIKNAKEIAATKLEANKKIIESEGAVQVAVMRTQGASERAIEAAQSRTKQLIASITEKKNLIELQAELDVLTPERGEALHAATTTARAAQKEPTLRFEQQKARLEKLRAANTGTPTEGYLTQEDIDKTVAAIHVRQVALGQVKALTGAEYTSALGLAAVESPGTLQRGGVGGIKGINQYTELLATQTKLLAGQRAEQAKLEAKSAEVEAKKIEADTALSDAVKDEENYRRRLVEVPLEIEQARKVGARDIFATEDVKRNEILATLIAGISEKTSTSVPANDVATALDKLFNYNQTTWNNMLAIIKNHQNAHTTTAQEIAALKSYAEFLERAFGEVAMSGGR